ncbi:YdcF family protein [Leifsonia sp. AG29]|uniref:YdcF family protein n=1 Tax=Leifsonia sp. AG29 TaxID=2598860 RepID=UPI00131B9F61|nr:YdcF family protein [Leifsonia sp. AG29]
MPALIAALLLALAAGILWRRDRRRLSVGVLGFLGVWCALVGIAALPVAASPVLAFGLAVVVGALPLLVLVLAGFLIANGVVVLRRERAGLSHGLSLIAGVILLVVPPLVGWFLRVATQPETPPMIRGLLVGFSALAASLSAYAGVFFVVVLLYGWVYRRSTRGATATAIIVLGSGLFGARVPPLLAARLDRGAEVFRRSEEAGLAPVIVPSGGKGADELVAEGAAMRDFLLLESGIPPARVLPETRSTNTEENLRFSQEIIADGTRAGAVRPGPVVIATSGYHVLRAAMLARRLGIDAEATGARVAAYFVPSATLREFVAIALLHPRVQLAAIAVCGLEAVAVGWATAR